MENGYSIYSDFDIEQHKKKYVNYLEVVVDADGTIMYAVPSHQEKVTALACKKLGITRTELSDMCPKEYYFDYITWLCMAAEAAAVWGEFCVAPRPTKQQVASLRRLRMAGLYKGPVPKIL